MLLYLTDVNIGAIRQYIEMGPSFLLPYILSDSAHSKAPWNTPNTQGSAWDVAQDNQWLGILTTGEKYANKIEFVCYA